MGRGRLQADARQIALWGSSQARRRGRANGHAHAQDGVGAKLLRVRRSVQIDHDWSHDLVQSISPTVGGGDESSMFGPPSVAFAAIALGSLSRSSRASCLPVDAPTDGGPPKEPSPARHRLPRWDCARFQIFARLDFDIGITCWPIIYSGLGNYGEPSMSPIFNPAGQINPKRPFLSK
jgi:hypothetical protein